MARLWISDTHLGNPQNNLHNLLKVLNRRKWETIFLVGDILDLDALNEYGEFSEEEHKVFSWILGYLRTGGNVVWLTGNHDRAMAALKTTVLCFPNLSFVDEYKEKKLWVVHGDRYDLVYQAFKRFTTWGGGSAGMGFWYNLYTKLGMWRNRLARQTKKRKCTTVICGHMHLPEDSIIKGIRYINCGDWMGSSTWVEEDEGGNINVFTFKGEQMVIWGI